MHAAWIMPRPCDRHAQPPGPRDLFGHPQQDPAGLLRRRARPRPLPYIRA